MGSATTDDGEGFVSSTSHEPGIRPDGGPTFGVGDSTAAQVPTIDEPAQWRQTWWAAERAGHDPEDLVMAITAEAWTAWGRVLASAGADRSWLATVVGGYRRELWLWLVGERTWEQTCTGLAGRVTRRLAR